jgi:hypothetical protein
LISSSTPRWNRSRPFTVAAAARRSGNGYGGRTVRFSRACPSLASGGRPATGGTAAGRRAQDRPQSPKNQAPGRRLLRFPPGDRGGHHCFRFSPLRGPARPCGADPGRDTLPHPGPGPARSSHANTGAAMMRSAAPA